MSYALDIPAHWCAKAARYVDRILKGEKAADLLVQEPTRLDLAINLKMQRRWV